MGHKVFRSTPESFPVKFIPGDAFDDAFLAPGPIVTKALNDEPPVDVAALTSLTPLRGRLSAIHASSFFHLFSESQQRELAHRLASLLSPEPGSLIFGVHVARPEKGLRVEFVRGNAAGARMFCHCPESWTALWEGVFGRGKVEVRTLLPEVPRPDAPPGVKTYMMVWSVKRL